MKSKLFKAEKTQWVIPCNPAYYDVCGVFNKLDKVEWKQSTNVNVGDIVYIYVTSPIKEIRYKCVARKVDLDYADTEKDREFILKGDNYENCGRYMELELITKYKENKFTLENLKQNGLKSVQGPSKVSEELANYIKSNEIDMIKETLQEEKSGVTERITELRKQLKLNKGIEERSVKIQKKTDLLYANEYRAREEEQHKKSQKKERYER